MYLPKEMKLLLLCGLCVAVVAQETVNYYYPGYEDIDFAHDEGGIGECEDGSWHLTKLGDEVCIKELGCFKLTKDYYHPQYRPCNVLPEPRSIIYTRFVLFTRENIRQGKFLDADNQTSITASGFNANHSTVFIVHGFQENPLYDPWILDNLAQCLNVALSLIIPNYMAQTKVRIRLRKLSLSKASLSTSKMLISNNVAEVKILMRELLNYNNTNVVVVDWSKGSDSPYIQAVANARVVGAEIARMTNALKKFGNLTTNMMHIIGHGLGAHVAGYAGQSILPMVSRITGLDPAYKYFCNMPDNVRLDLMDADFVDVIHTGLKSYDSGHGGCHKLGHVDFFTNDPTSSNGHHEGLEEQQQAVSMFISTIRNSTCQMIGYYCRSYKSFLRGECSDCGNDGSRCASLGFRADRYLPFKNSNFSSMYLVTGSFPNFCVYEYRIQMLLEHRNTGLENYSKSGNLLVLLRGEYKPLFVHLRFYSLHEGKEYTFLVTSGVNIGEIQNVTVRWEEHGTYDEVQLSGQTVWYYQNSNVDIEKIVVTLLNFQPSQEVRGPVETEFCQAASTNEPGWLTYLPNCV